MTANKFLFALIAFTTCTLQTASADSPNVTAVLSNSEAAVGETVRLQIKITGGRGAEAPQDIEVDGLEIHRTGTQQQIEMHNFSMSSSVIYDYTILPMKAGTFRIPPQTIKIGGTSLRTPELTLNVSDAGGSGSASRPLQNSQRGRSVDTSKIAFLEFVVPKREGYVGEELPAEIKIGSRAQLVQQPELPDLNVQGITFQKDQRPQPAKLENRNGANYRVWTVKGALAAVRPGRLEIPSLQGAVVALVPRDRPNTRNRPRDLFGDDPFDDPFFNDAFAMLRGDPVKIALHSDGVTLDIKPLPPNPPASFSGAVGTFTMNVEAKPKSVQVGDPITVTATIAGRGNFSSMSAPTLEDQRGWHTYPPSNKFAQNDDVGISGTKTFEMVVSPNEKKTVIPSLSFSYFDPLKEKYVTLRSEAIPIQVEGGATASVQPAAPATAPQTQAASSPAPTAKPEDILYQLKDRGPIQSFTPIYGRPVFWLAQIIPLAALIIFAGWKVRLQRLGNREAKRIATLHHESAELLKQLRRKDLSPAEYFDRAARAIRLRTALAKNVDPNTVDAELAATAFDLDPESRRQLRQLFDRSDELRYSGTGNGTEKVSPENRREVLELVERLRT